MDGIGLMASAMRAAQSLLDVSAGNLANASSDGFERRVTRARLTPGGITVRSVIDRTPGPLRRTQRAFDLAIAGGGALFVAAPGGRAVATRGGAFERDAAGRLCDALGRALLGRRGVLRVTGDASIDGRGDVRERDGIVDRVRTAPGTTVQSGALEGPNVEPVREMIDILGAQRAFETEQKTLVVLDAVRQKDAGDVARVSA